MNLYSNIPYSHNALKVFETVARHMSFTTAAQELHVTQSAVSRQVKQLEDDLNASLVIRRHRSIQLTLKGQALYEVLGRNYAALQSLLNSWKESEAKKIVIRAALSYATRALLPKIQQLNERFPNYEIAVIPVIDEEESLGKGDYDLFVFTTRNSESYDNDPEIFFSSYSYGWGPTESRHVTWLTRIRLWRPGLTNKAASASCCVLPSVSCSRNFARFTGTDFLTASPVAGLSPR